MTINRALSSMVVLIYLVYAFNYFEFVRAAEAALGLTLPLLCIWFPDFMGNYAGWFYRGITNSSPPRLLLVLGWIVLLIPFMIWTVYVISNAD